MSKQNWEKILTMVTVSMKIIVRISPFDEEKNLMQQKLQNSNLHLCGKL
ncbi:MAG: hypothetical protein ACOC1X_03210 [Promethearchaeota archaeon]